VSGKDEKNRHAYQGRGSAVNTDPVRCLVTGANSRIGRFLQAAWRGDDAIVPVWCARRPPADFVWAPGRGVPDLPRCDAVAALWGPTVGDARTLAQNSELAHAAWHLARACGAGRVIHLSSAAIYGPGTQLHETRAPAPAGVYGTAKLEMERTISGLPRDGLRHVILRVANVIGADSLSAALRDQTRPVTLDRFDDGTGPCRSYVAPGDLARVLAALVRLSGDSLPDILNVAAPQPVAMEDLARAAGHRVIWRAAPATAQARVSLDTARLDRLLPGVVRCITPERMIADWHRLETRD
jgi:nucleoside-diphosphate-sugar epimerase